MKIMKKNKICHCFPVDPTGAYEVNHLVVLNIYERPNCIVVYVHVHVHVLTGNDLP